MMSKESKSFQRSQAAELAKRLQEPRPWIQIVTGARQVGKTTLVQQVTEGMDLPVRFASADEPSLRDRDWLVSQWEAACFELAEAGGILVIDEIQKV